MSCSDLFMKYGSPSTEANFTKHFYYQRADQLIDAQRIADADKRADRDIKELLQLVSDLREYRQTLAARYAELETMPYKLKLELKRQRNYSSNKIYYYVTISKVFDDGTTQLELNEKYAGTERHKAISRYEELKKQRPGIEAIKDIEKGRWER